MNGEEIIRRRESAHSGHREQERYRQIVGDGGHGTHQLNQRSHDHETEVVIVDVVTGEPGVIRREPGRFHHCVEIGEIHRFLAADDRVPQVRLQETHAHPEHVEQREQSLHPQENVPAATQETAQAVPAEPAHPAAHQGQEQRHTHDGPPGVGHEAQTGRDPGEVGHDQQTHDPRRAVSPVAQARQRREQQREGQPAQERHHDPPGDRRQRRIAVEQPVVIEHLRPGSTRPLLGPSLWVELEPIGRVGRLLGGLPVESLRDVYSAQGRNDPLTTIFGGLAEDEHTGMVINAESLLGWGQANLDRLRLINERSPTGGRPTGGRPPIFIGRYIECKWILLIGELERPDSRTGGEIGRQVETQFPGEERPVIGDCQGIAVRQARDRGVEPVASDDDVIGPVEPIEKLGLLLPRILIVKLHLETVVQAAIGIVSIQRQRRRPIPMLGRQRRPGRHVGIDPAGGGEPGMLAQVDGKHRRGPQGGPRHDEGGETNSHETLPTGGRAAQARQEIGRHQHKQRVQRQEIAHRLDPSHPLVDEHHGSPPPRDQVGQSSLPPAPQFHPDHGPTGPRRQAQRQAHPPHDDVDPGEKDRGAISPLAPGGKIGRAALLRPNLFQPIEPLRAEAHPEETGPLEGVRLGNPEGDEGKYARQA